MEITTQQVGDETRIHLHGRLDAAWSAMVDKAFEDTIHQGCHHIALDLSQVVYLSSAGIRVLVILAKKLKAIGGELRLLEVSAPVREVLELVGFSQLLQRTQEMPSAAAATHQERGEFYQWSYGGIDFEVYDLSFDVYDRNEDVVQSGQVLEKPAVGQGGIAMRVAENVWAIGHGILGGADGNIGLAGELLAVNGLALTLPGDDPAHPDWLQQEGELVPEICLLHGLKAEGKFRYLLRFGMAAEAPPVGLSELAQAAMQLCAADTVALVMLAETVQVVGAALQVPAGRSDSKLFAFPAIREQLLFTAEPAFSDETCLIVGVVARHPRPHLAKQLRPCAAGSELYMHLHACIVPFCPVPKGHLELHDGLEKLMGSQIVKGILHLLNDDREGIGAGETCLNRGAIWCAPAHFNGESS